MDGNGKQGQEGPRPGEKAELQIEKEDPLSSDILLKLKMPQ